MSRDEADLRRAGKAGEDAEKENNGGQDKTGTGNPDNLDQDSEKADNTDDTDDNGDTGCKTWLQVLPSRGGVLLAALLVEIMTEGLTPDQMNILGNFVASVGTLISYKASRDDVDS